MHIEGPPGTFGFEIYTDEEYASMQDEEDTGAEMMAAWQFHDEIEYQAKVAISYPQDVQAIFAANWLRTQGVW